MIKYIFALVMLIHGLIHFMGFAKAFGYGNIAQLTKEITKPSGLLWLVSALLFITAVVLFLLKKDSWSTISIIAFALSQILIISVWKDAKFGSIANIIILLIAIPSFATNRFNSIANEEAKVLLAGTLNSDKVIITKEMLTNLPPVIQKWLTHSGVIGKQKINTVRLQQRGTLKTTMKSKWIRFTANQYFNVEDPAFVWKANVEMMPLVTLNGRDKFINGKGSLVIKALSLFTVAKGDDNEKINSASMIRYLSETMWFPTAALNNYIKWEVVDSLSAKAIMTYQGVTVSGIFKFNEAGDIVAFTANRYYGTDDKASEEKWLIETTGYKNFNDIRIPYKNKVTWQLKEGDFNWADIELTSLEFNCTEIYAPMK
ncbi:DUF6544 family protein [Ferruginibacter sp.]|nr:hypothetical protein [Ferruginibacter sp.]